MKIIVCCKIVPEEQDIVVNADRSVDTGKAALKISQYDLNAIEAAMCLAGEGDEVVALSAGPAKNLSNSKICKDILSRGPARLELVSDDSLAGALPDVTAQVLAAPDRRGQYTRRRGWRGTRAPELPPGANLPRIRSYIYRA